MGHSQKATFFKHQLDSDMSSFQDVKIDKKARSEATFRYTLQNFSKLTACRYSPQYYARNLPWRITVEPYDSQNENGCSKRSLSFYLYCNKGSNSKSWSCYADAKLRILPVKPDIEPFSQNLRAQFYSDADTWGFEEFMAWNDVLNPKKGYIKDDTITLEVHLVADVPYGVSQDSIKHTGETSKCGGDSDLVLRISSMPIKTSDIGYKTWMDFNDELISSGVFNCNQCKNVLIPPVMLSNRYGNICSICYQHLSEGGDTNICVENKALSVILCNMLFPCQYKNAGCQQKFSIDILKCHEEVCYYKTIPCLYSSTCSWSGWKADLIKHLEIHKDKVLQNNDDTFVVETNLESESDNLHILETSSGKFIIRFKVLPDLKIMYSQVYDYEGKDLKYVFQLKIESKHNIGCSYKTVLKMINGAGALPDFKISDATEVNLDALKQFLGAEEVARVKTVVKLLSKDKECYMEKNMLKLLKCLECKNLVRPPIYLCGGGHTICSYCKATVNRCSFCNEAIGVTRSCTLEDLAHKLRYPCRYESSGCKVKAVLTSNHETVCNYQVYNCFMKECQFKGAFIDLMDHLRNVHDPLCCVGVETACFKRLNQDDAQVATVCFLNYNNIFEIRNQYDADDLNWSIQFLSPCNDKSTFVCEIGLFDVYQFKQALIKRETLKSKQVCTLSISRYEVEEFLDENTIDYYIRIIKKC